ncbi:MAG: hypothetical protein WA375_15790, partial [Pseudolabrys sp.]
VARNRERGSKLGAENEVAGGGIDGFRWNVNGSAGCCICQITFYEFEVAICPHYVRFSVNSARCPEPEPRALIRQNLDTEAVANNFSYRASQATRQFRVAWLAQTA